MVKLQYEYDSVFSGCGGSFVQAETREEAVECILDELIIECEEGDEFEITFTDEEDYTSCFAWADCNSWDYGEFN